MKDFAALFTAIDQTTKTNAKVAALARYLKTNGRNARVVGLQFKGENLETGDAA